jgi:hypothetical protein
MDGREPVTTTTYEYDDDGRVARTVAVREPEWTEQDRAELLALALYRTWLCPCGCGYLAKDTFSHEEIGPAFKATHLACRATLALLEAQRASDTGKPNPNARARVWHVEMTRR